VNFTTFFGKSVNERIEVSFHPSTFLGRQREDSRANHKDFQLGFSSRPSGGTL
jgi:hypothetical protein